MKMVIAQSNLTLKGGAERVLLKIAQHYDAKIYVAEYDPAKTFEEFKDMDVEVIGRQGLLRMLPYGRAVQGLNYGLSFYGLNLKNDYDVINAHMAPSHWIRNKNERVLWYCHTPLRDVYDLYHYRLSLKKLHQKPVHIIGTKAVKMIDQSVTRYIEFIFANSFNTRSRIVKYYGRKDAEVLWGGVEYEQFKRTYEEKYFLYPSRISPNKQQDVAIRAFDLFKRYTKGYRLIIAGAISQDKFYYNYYKNVNSLANAVGDVDIITNVSDKMLKKLYSNCTAVLYPPINEDYGLVPLEAMASSKPVIAFNEGGPKETIEHEQTGFLVNNIEEMSNAMKEIAENPAVGREMGKNGRERVVKYYSWKRFFKEFDKKVKMVKKL